MKGKGTGGMPGDVKRRRRNSFGKPWKGYCKRIRVGGARGRMACSRNQNGEGGRIGKSECWDGDGRLPGRRMTSCGRRRYWVGDRVIPGGRINWCGSYSGY